MLVVDREDQPLNSMEAIAHLLMVLNESSTCFHEFYLNTQYLSNVASFPDVVLSQAYERADSPTTTFKSIRKLLLSKSTTSAQKLTWRRAGDWEGLLSRTIKLVVRQTVDRSSRKYITTSIVSTNMKKLFTVLSSPMHLFAVLFADLDKSNASKSYLRNYASKSYTRNYESRSGPVPIWHRWGKDVMQIVAAVTMEGGLDSCLSNGVDQDKIAEIEKKRDELIAKVKEISKEIDDLEAQLLLLKVRPSSAKKESGSMSLPPPIAKSTSKSTARLSTNPVTTTAAPATSTSQTSASFAGTDNRFPSPAPTSSPASNSRNAPAESGTAWIPPIFRFQPTLNPHVFKGIVDGSVKYYLINSVQRGEVSEILLHFKSDDEMIEAFHEERATRGTSMTVADGLDYMRECGNLRVIQLEQLGEIIAAGTTYSTFGLAQAAALVL